MNAADKYVVGHLYALEADTINRLFEEYQHAYINMAIGLEAAFNRYGQQDTWSADDAFFRARTEYLMQQIMREMDRLSTNTQDISLKAAQDAYNTSYYGRAWMTDVLAGGTALVPILPIEMIRAQVLAPYEGSTFVDRFANNRLEFEARIRKAIVQSQIEGEGIGQAQKRLSSELGVDIAFGRKGKTKQQKAAFNRTQMIARTEIIKSSYLGAQHIYEKNRDVLRGWIVGVAHDERTCPKCVDANNNDHVYQIGKGPRLPIHVNCRCASEPAIADADLEKRIVGTPETFKEWADRKGITKNMFGQAYDLKARPAPKSQKGEQ
jgi:hypothetical protein